MPEAMIKRYYTAKTGVYEFPKRWPVGRYSLFLFYNVLGLWPSRLSTGQVAFLR